MIDWKPIDVYAFASTLSASRRADVACGVMLAREIVACELPGVPSDDRSLIALALADLGTAVHPDAATRFSQLTAGSVDQLVDQHRGVQ